MDLAVCAAESPLEGPREPAFFLQSALLHDEAVSVKNVDTKTVRAPGCCGPDGASSCGR